MAKPRTYIETETRVFNVMGAYWVVTTETKGYDIPETRDEPPDGEFSEKIVGLVIVSRGGKPADYAYQLAQAHQAIQTGSCPHGDGGLSLALLNASQGLLDGQGLMREVSEEIVWVADKEKIIRLSKNTK